MNPQRRMGYAVQTVRWAIVVGAWITYAALYVRLGRLLLTNPGSSDFTIFYYTARMVADGLPMYGDLPPAYGLEWPRSHLGNLNAPHFQLVMLPFALLGYRDALAAWGVANALLVATSLRAIVRELEIPLTPRRVLLGGIAILASVPWMSVMITGEMSLLLLYPFTRAWIAARHGRWRTAGGWIGFLASFKSFFVLFAVWLAIKGSWRGGLGAVVAAGAAVAVGATAFGAAPYVEWLSSLGRIAWWSMPMNVSIRGLAERLFDPGGGMSPVWNAAAVVRPLWITAAAGVMMVTFWRLWTVPDRDRAMLLLLLAALLLSPLGWVYYLSLATGPFLALVWRRALIGANGSAVLIIPGVMLLYLPGEFTQMAQPAGWATLTLASAYTWAVLLCWAGLVIPKPVPHCGSKEPA